MDETTQSTEKTFTQDEVNQIVQERLFKERKKYGEIDIDALKADTEALKGQFGPAFSGGRPFTFGSVPSGSVSAPSVTSSKTPEVTYKAEHTKPAGGGSIPEVKQGTSSNPIGGSKSSGNVISNGATYSGGTNKSSRSLKYVPSTKVLPHGEDRMESYDVEGQTGGASGGNEDTLNNIESRVKSIQPWSLAEQLGFSAKSKQVTYNGTSIDQLLPEQIREVLKILDILGV